MAAGRVQWQLAKAPQESQRGFCTVAGGRWRRISGSGPYGCGRRNTHHLWRSHFVSDLGEGFGLVQKMSGCPSNTAPGNVSMSVVAVDSLENFFTRIHL